MASGSIFSLMDGMTALREQIIRGSTRCQRRMFPSRRSNELCRWAKARLRRAHDRQRNAGWWARFALPTLQNVDASEFVSPSLLRAHQLGEALKEIVRVARAGRGL